MILAYKGTCKLGFVGNAQTTEHGCLKVDEKDQEKGEERCEVHFSCRKMAFLPRDAHLGRIEMTFGVEMGLDLNDAMMLGVQCRKLSAVLIVEINLFLSTIYFINYTSLDVGIADLVYLLFFF